MTGERYSERKKSNQTWSSATKNRDKIQRKGELQFFSANASSW